MVAAGVALLGAGAGCAGDDTSSRAAADPPPAWTLDEAFNQLKLYPNDAFLQYVVLQHARRHNRLDEYVGRIENEVLRTRNAGSGRARDVDLFGLFTGALAVQESLQLDTMRGNGTRRGQRPEIGRAIGNLMTALRNRVVHDGWNEELLEEVVDILDEAAQRIERVKDAKGKDKDEDD